MHSRCLLFFAGIVAAGTVAEAAVDTQIPKSKFSCNGRSSGYYADVNSGCQVYHMCDGLGRQFSYTCPNATLFQQRMLICDHWYMVNCSKSESDYSANLRIGQREMPFVDDSESNPYHRTPRPDLLSHPSQSEYDIIYRTGKAYAGNNRNLVGAESDSKNTTSTTDEPTYSLPSHWSTEYSHHSTSPRTRTFPTTTTEPPLVNFKSSYKATTPVFPLTVDEVTASPELQPPLPYQLQNRSDAEEVPTTNFGSLFKATTPVYPLSVDVTSEEPSEVGLLPPKAPEGAANATQDLVPSLDVEILPPSEDSKAGGSEDITEAQPSKYYQPPKFDSVSQKGGFKKMLGGEEWASLRRKYFIPDYEFPLESVSRPSYDSLLSSFQVNSGPPENVIKNAKEAA